MPRALSTITRADPALCIDRVTLDLEARRKRRQRLTTNAGLSFVVDLAEAPELRHGDGLLLEDGSIIGVETAFEPLMEVTATDWPHLLRIAWHLGNRHLPTELAGDRLRIREDHVIRDMVERLGGTVRAVQAPFDPEGGAYGHGAVHSHD